MELGFLVWFMKLLIVSFHCIALFKDRHYDVVAVYPFFFMPIWGGRIVKVDIESFSADIWLGELQVYILRKALDSCMFKLVLQARTKWSSKGLNLVLQLCGQALQWLSALKLLSSLVFAETTCSFGSEVVFFGYFTIFYHSSRGPPSTLKQKKSFKGRSWVSS